MLRTILLACAIALPGVAMAEELPASPLGLEIRADNGESLGRVEGVVRNRDGRVVAVDSTMAEPADAPASAGDLVAGNEGDAYSVLASLRREHQDSAQLTAARYDESQRLR